MTNAEAMIIVDKVERTMKSVWHRATKSQMERLLCVIRELVEDPQTQLDRITMIMKLTASAYEKYPSLRWEEDCNPVEYYEGLTDDELKAEYELNVRAGKIKA